MVKRMLSFHVREETQTLPGAGQAGGMSWRSGGILQLVGEK